MKQYCINLFVISVLFLVTPLSATACEGKCDPADCSKHKTEMNHKCNHAAMEGEENSALDPICGVRIGESHAVDQVEYKGKKYFFCMKEEKEAFLKEPEKYLNQDEE